GTLSQRVVLFLDSAGGQVDEGDRVIEVLKEIKQRHQLITVVPDGKLCASMCIPIFLQGEDRLAARASLWIFHEAAQRQANGQQGEPTWRRRGGCSANTTNLPVSQCIWLKSIAPNDQGRRSVANRRSHQREERRHPASAGGPDRAGRSASAS